MLAGVYLGRALSLSASRAAKYHQALAAAAAAGGSASDATAVPRPPMLGRGLTPATWQRMALACLAIAQRVVDEAVLARFNFAALKLVLQASVRLIAE